MELLVMSNIYERKTMHIGVIGFFLVYNIFWRLKHELGDIDPRTLLLFLANEKKKTGWVTY